MEGAVFDRDAGRDEVHRTDLDGGLETLGFPDAGKGLAIKLRDCLATGDDRAILEGQFRFGNEGGRDGLGVSLIVGFHKPAGGSLEGVEPGGGFGIGFRGGVWPSPEVGAR